MLARYRYGELRLTRLNFYALLFLRKFHFEQVYGDFFRQFYGPILFVFTIISSILNKLAIEQLMAQYWVSLSLVYCWFSILNLMGAAVISAWFIVL